MLFGSVWTAKPEIVQHISFIFFIKKTKKKKKEIMIIKYDVLKEAEQPTQFARDHTQVSF